MSSDFRYRLGSGPLRVVAGGDDDDDEELELRLRGVGDEEEGGMATTSTTADDFGALASVATIEGEMQSGRKSFDFLGLKFGYQTIIIMQKVKSKLKLKF